MVARGVKPLRRLARRGRGQDHVDGLEQGGEARPAAVGDVVGLGQGARGDAAVVLAMVGQFGMQPVAVADV
ncbi:hypothetical protein D3C71_2126540 [compost metagenome]